MTRDCTHGFSSRELCPVCQHFEKILEAEAKEREALALATAALRAARALRDALEAERLDSDGPGE